MGRPPETIKPTNKITDPVTEERLSLVVELILDGNTRDEIAKMCVKSWGIQRQVVNRYIDKATERVQHVFDARYETKASGLVSSLQRVYRESLQAGEYKSAIEAIKAIAAIQGMDKKVLETHNKTDITVKDAEDFKSLSTKDLLKIVNNS